MSAELKEKLGDDEVQEQPSTPTLAPEHTFPEGGTRGWLVVLGCFCVMFFTFGYVNAFG
jgi:hypothetical protein